MQKNKREKRPLAPTASRYLATLSLEEDLVIRKAAKALALPRGVFIRTAAMKMAAECGYFLDSADKPDSYPSLPANKSAWAEAMK